MNYPIPILMYHRIDRSPVDTATPPDVFRQHLELLKEHRWKSLSADEFAYYVRTRRPVPFRSFLITFDDGHASIAASALKILQEFDFKAISFVCTKYLRDPRHGQTVPAPDDDPALYMSWDQARELQSSGVIDCQSHTHSHTRFDGQTPAAIKQDLGTSIELLTSELRLPRSHFVHLAWPWGLSTREWRAAASTSGFIYQYGVSRMACTMDLRLDQLPRISADANTVDEFRLQLWLQTGYLYQLWNFAYPLGRKLRRFVSPARV